MSVNVRVTGDGGVMGAVLGCKHMLAVERHLEGEQAKTISRCRSTGKKEELPP